MAQVKVKICGLTQEADVENIAAMGPDYMGFIFTAKSARYIDPERAGSLIKRVQGRAEPVGVFVDEAPENILRLSQECGLRFVQLHGDEPEEDIALLVREGISVIRAARVKDASSLAAALRTPAEFVLLDAYREGFYGGTGKNLDSDILRALQEKITGKGKRVFLSGGLSASSVYGVLSLVQPYALDASSLLEVSPGRKDLEKTRAFIRSVRGFPGKG